MSILFSRHFRQSSSGTSGKIPSAPEQTSSLNNGKRTVGSSSSKRKSQLPTSDLPTIGNYASTNLTLGAGVAIFHLATARVVLCYHSAERYHFLPKGRRDVNEASTCGAEREGFEESGFRNRLIPLPIQHRQPLPHHPTQAQVASMDFSIEPIWTQLAPIGIGAQYVLFWYIAETVSPEMEDHLSLMEKAESGAYQQPEPWKSGLTVKQRIGMESTGYEPIRHENTGVDEDEAMYVSSLVSVEEAIMKLGHQSIAADVVRRGWAAIQRRRHMEEDQ